ncbi:MAG: YbjN domain-containing protein [Actinomycetota bacterium]
MTTSSEPNPQTITTESPSSTDIITDKMIEDATAISYVEEIETVIASMTPDGKVMFGQNDTGGYLWKFPYGSVEVFVQLTGQTEDDTLTVWSVVLSLPVNNEAQLTRKLLEINWLSTFESHFAISDNQVVIVSTRTVAELSPGEISRAITIVATLADENDDALQAEFGQ